VGLFFYMDDFLTNRIQQEQDKLHGFKEEQGGLLDRYRGTIASQESLPAMNERIGSELGLPALRQNAFQLNETLRNMPQVQSQATRGFDVNANQLQRIIASQQGKMAPLAQEATRASQFAEGELGERMRLSQAEQARQLQPFEMERDLLSDRIAREMTAFSQQKEQELTVLLTKFNRDNYLSDREWQRANELADAESEFDRQKELIKLQRSATPTFDWTNWMNAFNQTMQPQNQPAVDPNQFVVNKAPLTAIKSLGTPSVKTVTGTDLYGQNVSDYIPNNTNLNFGSLPGLKSNYQHDIL
jgi:hypothetical protein